jgi:transposase InsO family protein
MPSRRRIVGYSFGDRMTSDLVVSALGSAITLRRPTGTICHRDRGSQFCSGDFVRTIKNNGLRGSMEELVQLVTTFGWSFCDRMGSQELSTM